jgi:hypothetical protein
MNLLGRLTAFIFITSHRRILGISYSFFVKIIFPVLAFWAWWQQQPWSNPVAIGLLVAGLLVYLGYWYMRRRGFTFFVASEKATLAANVKGLREEQRQLLRTTGMFAVEEMKDYVFLRNAQMWLMPGGDVAIMVAYKQKKFLYEFITSGMARAVVPGHLLFGPEPQPTLALTFGSTWGPEFSKFDRTYVVGMEPGAPPNEKTIYLSFESEGEMLPAWKTLMGV